MNPSVIDAYLERLGAELNVPNRLRRDLLEEARAGLHDAADALVADFGPERALRIAVNGFGDPRDLAAQFDRIHVVSTLRRVAGVVLTFLPVQCGLWALLWATSWSSVGRSRGGLPVGWIYLVLTGCPVACALAVLLLTRGATLPTSAGRLRAVVAVNTGGMVGAALLVALTLARFAGADGDNSVEVFTSSVWSAALHIAATLAVATLVVAMVRAGRGLRRLDEA